MIVNTKWGGGVWLFSNSRVTRYFGAGGWVLLRPTWLWTMWRYEHARRVRVRQAEKNL